MQKTKLKREIVKRRTRIGTARDKPARRRRQVSENLKILLNGSILHGVERADDHGEERGSKFDGKCLKQNGKVKNREQDS